MQYIVDAWSGGLRLNAQLLQGARDDVPIIRRFSMTASLAVALVRQEPILASLVVVQQHFGVA